MKNKNPNLKRMKFLIILLFIALFLYPFESTVVPAKNVLVVTEDWKPIQDAMVRQSWKNYSLEYEGHEQDSRTDENGRVTFPRRTMRASILRRLVYPLWNLLRQGIHASFGVQTSMVPLGEVSEKPIGKNIVEARSGDVIFRLR